MSEIHTGARYVEALSALPSDRLARSAFQDLVLRIARPGAALFDFGAGPGIDARFYAGFGFRVGAYDVDPGMCDFFSVHCGALIQAGQIELHTGTYPDFLASEAPAGATRADLVTSNFAPLNLIEDLRSLFLKFHALTAPDGKVLASVLSPYFLGDLRYRWWWSNCRQLWRKGHFAVPGARGPIVRRRLADFAAQSAPYFALKRVFPGLPSIRERDAHGIDMSRRGSRAWLRLMNCRFMFLLFEKLRLEPPANETVHRLLIEKEHQHGHDPGNDERENDA
jgi:SAM-dependent methyltransferase